MTINTIAIMDAVAVLADDRNMRVTLQESGKGALICGATCFVGGLLAGPVGLAVGGMLGGLGAASLAKNFKPVSEIIRRDLTARQREELSEKIMNAIREVGISDVVMLTTVFLGNQSVQEAVIKTVISYITNEMNLQIC